MTVCMRLFSQPIVVAFTFGLLSACYEKSTTEPEDTRHLCLISQPLDGTAFALGDTLEITVNTNDDRGNPFSSEVYFRRLSIEECPQQKSDFVEIRKISRQVL